MEVILLNKITESLIVEYPVVGFRRGMINYRGKKQWCFIVYLKNFTKAYPCNQHDLHCITLK